MTQEYTAIPARADGSYAQVEIELNGKPTIVNYFISQDTTAEHAQEVVEALAADLKAKYEDKSDFPSST
jgi:hypothetical protein